MGEDMVAVHYYGKAFAECEGDIFASEDRPYPVAALSNGRVRAATHGDYVAAMAISNSDGGRVLLSLNLPRPGHHGFVYSLREEE